MPKGEHSLGQNGHARRGKHPGILKGCLSPVYQIVVNAVINLEALYFLLAGVKDRFVYLNYGLAIILAFVGVKMIISMWVHLPPWISLAVIAVVLTVTIAASLYASRTERARD